MFQEGNSQHTGRPRGRKSNEANVACVCACVTCKAPGSSPSDKISSRDSERESSRSWTITTHILAEAWCCPLKVGKYRPTTAFYACDTNILPRTQTLKLPLPRSSPLSPNPFRSFFQSLSILPLLLIPPPAL